MAGSRIKGITVEIGGDTTKLQNLDLHSPYDELPHEEESPSPDAFLLTPESPESQAFPVICAS